MNRVLTDRERCQVLEARVAELEEEVAAWRAEHRGELETEAAMQRAVRLRDRLQRADKRCALCATAMLIHMIDHPGTVASKLHLVEASRYAGASWDNEPNLKVADVQVSILRRCLVALGAANVIETVWGCGYRVSEDSAQRVKALLEPRA